MKILNETLILPVSTAECERAFLTMKRVKIALRNRLITANLNHLMRISINGPIIQNSTSSKQLLYRVTRDSEESKYNDNICVCMYIILTLLLIILTSIINYLYINDPNFEHLKISMSTYKAKNLLLKASTFGGTSTPCC